MWEGEGGEGEEGREEEGVEGREEEGKEEVDEEKFEGLQGRSHLRSKALVDGSVSANDGFASYQKNIKGFLQKQAGP